MSNKSMKLVALRSIMVHIDVYPSICLLTVGGTGDRKIKQKIIIYFLTHLIKENAVIFQLKSIFFLSFFL